MRISLNYDDGGNLTSVHATFSVPPPNGIVQEIADRAYAILDKQGKVCALNLFNVDQLDFLSLNRLLIRCKQQPVDKIL